MFREKTNSITPMSDSKGVTAFVRLEIVGTRRAVSVKKIIGTVRK